MIQDYLNSLWNYRAYPEFLRRTKKQIALFAAFIILLFWALTTVIPMVNLKLQIGSAAAFLEKNVPEFSLSGGKLSVQEAYHYADGRVYLDLNTSPDHVLDPDDQNFRTILGLNDVVAAADSEKVIFKADTQPGLAGGGARMVRFSDLPDVSFTKADLVDMGPVFEQWLLIFTIFSYFFHLILFFIGVLSIAFIGQLFARLSRLDMRVGEVYKLAVYTRSLPLLLKSVFFLLGYQFAEFPALSVLYSVFVLTRVYRIMAIRILEEEARKQGMFRGQGYGRDSYIRNSGARQDGDDRRPDYKTPDGDDRRPDYKSPDGDNRQPTYKSPDGYPAPGNNSAPGSEGAVPADGTSEDGNALPGAEGRAGDAEAAEPKDLIPEAPKDLSPDDGWSFPAAASSAGMNTAARNEESADISAAARDGESAGSDMAIREEETADPDVVIRKAEAGDIDAVEAVYDEIHSAEEAGELTIGWIRGVYPVRATAEAALQRGDLFVLEDGGQVRGAAVINQIQVDVYAGAPWKHAAEDNEVLVLHTLVISPESGRKGYGKRFIRFYEDYASEHGCPELRIDTNARNLTAREMYRKLGYEEIAVVPTEFNGISGVDLVLLEKYLGSREEA